MSAFSFARLVVALKWRLLSRAKSGFEKFSLVFTLVLGVIAIPLVAWVVVLIGGHRDAASILMVAMTFVGLGWLLLTIVGGGGESVIDPQLFTIYPVAYSRLVVGFLAAAFVGVPALATASAALATVAHGASLLGRLVILVAAVVLTLTAVLCGRVGISWMSGMLRSRRTREIATWTAAIVGSMVGAIGPIASELGILSFDWSLLVDVRRWVRWLPWGWAPESIALAMEGRTGRAVLMLIPAIGFMGLVGRAWTRLLARILTSRGVSGEGKVDKELLPAALRPFGRHPVVAVWARSLRQLRRDPREVLEVAAFMPAVLIFALPGIQALRDGDERAVLSTASVGLALGITTLNMFGADGRSFGVDALAASNMRDVVVGKALARISLGIPAVLLVATVLCVLSGGWSLFVPATAIAWTTLFASSGIGMMTSAKAPFPLPEKMNAGGGQNQGCATAVIRVAAMVAAVLAAAPGVIPTIIVSLRYGGMLGSLVGVASVAYGLAVFWGLAGSTGRWADSHVPRIFQEIARAT